MIGMEQKQNHEGSLLILQTVLITKRLKNTGMQNAKPDGSSIDPATMANSEQAAAWTVINTERIEQ